MEKTYPPIEEFIEARLEDVLHTAKPLSIEEFDEVQKVVQGWRLLLQWHGKWPTLLQSEPVYETKFTEDMDRISFIVSQKLEWLTQREYVERFGEKPPTAYPILMLARQWKDHPDFNPEWGD